MKSRELYTELQKQSTLSGSFFGRKLLVISEDSFRPFEQYFFETANIFNDKRNFRTKDAFRHIHAIKSGRVIEFHMDYGNLYQNPVMAVPHLLLDVIPYFSYHFLMSKKPYSFSLQDDS